MKIKNLYKFFDCIGVVAFAYLIVDSVSYLAAGETDWKIIIRLIIGIGGFLIDSFLVFIYKENKGV